MAERPSKNPRGPLAALALLVVGALAWWLWPAPAPPPPVAPALSSAPEPGPPSTTAIPPPSPAATRAAPVGPPPSWLEPRALEVRLNQEGGAEIAGRVVSTVTGRGVPHAELTFLAEDGVAHSVGSGEEGAFRFVASSEGRFALSVVTADGFLPYAPAWGTSSLVFYARPGTRVAGAVVPLVPSIRYTGVVLAPDGRPVQKAAVRMIATPRDTLALAPLEDTFTTDESGEFSFSAPDEAVFVAEHPGFTAARGRLDFAAQVSHRVVLRLGPPGAPSTATLAGRVLDEEEEPVAGAHVLVHDEEGQVSGEATAGAEGRYRLELAPGDVVVTAQHHQRGPVRREVTLPPGAEVELDLVLLEGFGRLDVRVLSDDGVPVTAFGLWVGRQEAPLLVRPHRTATAFGPDGVARVGGLVNGTYLVRVFASGFAPGEATAWITGSPKPTEVELVLRRGGSLEGLVLDEETRAPLASAVVAIEVGFDLGPGLPRPGSARTAEDGRFVIESAAPGRHSLTVAAGGHHGKIVSGVDVTEGAATGPLEIFLAPLREGEEVKRELSGIGAVLAAEADHLLIRQVIDEGGAAEAGLLAGDRIFAVDGEAVAGLAFQDALQRIRGPVGTAVRITYARGESPERIDVDVPRKKIRA